MNQNPVLVQTAPPRQYGYLRPLVLIHDGGGTVFGYFGLGSLGRKVWAIHNPHLATGEPWEGGIEEMADHYIKLMERAGIRGSILLGGWSLGGYLSIAIARKLAARAGSTLSVAGMLLIDSPYHPPTDQIPPSDAEPLLDDLPVLMKKSFEEAERMLETWELPRWDGPACGGRPTRFSTAGEEHTVLERTALHKGLDGQWRTLPASGWKPTTGDGLGKKIPASPPPAVMIRCVQRTPIATPVEDGPLQVDMYRDDPFLGWSSGEYPNCVQAAIDTDSGHYDVFKFSRIEQTTREINECLEILDNLRPG